MTYNLKDNQLMVVSGDLESCYWEFTDKFLKNDSVAIKLNELQYCSLIKDEHGYSQSSSGRIAGGILGGVLLGPLGAIGGLLTGGKKKIDVTIVYGKLQDGREFVAHTTQVGAASLIRIAGEYQPPTDLVDCPQCAEQIKKKAKICRFCGYSLASSSLKDENARVSSSNAEQGANAGFDLFISDYRGVVDDSPFESDKKIIEVLNHFKKLYQSDPQSEMGTIRKCVAKEFSKSAKDVEKLIYGVFSVDSLLARYRKRNPEGTFFSSLSKDQLLELLNIICSIRRHEVSKDFELEFRSTVDEYQIRTGRVLQDGIIRGVLYLLPDAVQGRFNFYLVGNLVLYVDKVTRKAKKKRNSAIAKDNSIGSSLVNNKEFINWYEEYFDNNVEASSSIRFYKAVKEVEKILNESYGEKYTVADFSESVRLYWWERVCNEDDSLDVMPDEWLAEHGEEAVRNFNELAGNKISDQDLYAAFRRGFSST